MKGVEARLATGRLVPASGTCGSREGGAAEAAPLLSLAVVPAVLSLVARGDLPAGGEAFAVAVCTLAVGLALEPDPELGEHHRRWARAIGPKALLGVCAALLVAQRARADASLCAAVGLGVGVVALLLAGVLRGLRILLGDPRWARVGTWLCAALAAGAPVWLGPLVERLGASPTLASGAVASSPLGVLAVLCGYDYLRAPWFYAHTPIGSLRFEPPPTALVIAAQLSAGLMLLLLKGQSDGGRNA